MLIRKRAALIAWTTWIGCWPALTGAQGTKPYVFRGVEPGATTAEQLKANTRWGAPKSEQQASDGSAQWQYQLQGYKQVIVTLRSGRVQTIDVKLPDGIRVDDAAAALTLGIPTEGAALGDAARIGAQMPQEWEPVAYSAGRVVLYVDRSRGQARALRSYAATNLAAAAALPAPRSGQIGAARNPAQAPRVPNEASREVMAGLAKVFPAKHISGHPVDEEIARRTLGLFIDELDASRLFFLRTDVVQAMRPVDKFANELRQGDIKRLYEIYRLYLQRLDQRQQLCEQLLADNHDFGADEQIDLSVAKDTWAENDLEIRETWRKRVKYQMLLHLESGASDDDARQRAGRDLRATFAARRNLTDDDLLSLAANALAGAFDTRSAYYTARAWEDIEIGLSSQLVGIGASLQMKSGYVEVVKLISGGPAATDGRLKEGDRIVAVGQGDEPFVEVVGMPLTKVVDLIRGAAGSKVRLRALPKDGFEAKVVDFTRQRFEMQNVGSAALPMDSIQRPGAKVGYIYLPTLYTDQAAQTAGQADYRSTARDLAKILADLRAGNVDVAVVDFRDNPGGTLREAIDVAANFIGVTPVMMVRDGQGQVATYEPQIKPTPWDRPLVLLTNKMSSGGAEIVAAAVQDYHRGIVVGDATSNCNGSIGTQSRLTELLSEAGQPVGDVNPDRLGMARISKEKFYRVNGNGIQSKGVMPDVHLPSLIEATTQSNSDFPYTLTFDTVKPATYAPTKPAMGEAAIQQLRAASEQRRNGSAYFQKLSEQIRRATESRRNTIVSLNKEKFVADRQATASLDADAAAVPGVPDVKLTPYLNEIFAVALDYAALQYAERADAALKERRYADALADLRHAVAADPTSKSARYKLAWSLSTLPSRQFRNGKQAVAEATRLVELDGRNNWMYLFVLAVAQAEAGNFDQAQTDLDAALAKAPETERQKYASLKQRFQRRQAYATQ